MAEKQIKPETFFDVGEIYSRLDQAIYDHREEEEKYGRSISDEMTKAYESALNVVIEIGRMHPRPDTEKKLTKVLYKMLKDQDVDEATYKIIIQQVY